MGLVHKGLEPFPALGIVRGAGQQMADGTGAVIGVVAKSGFFIVDRGQPQAVYPRLLIMIEHRGQTGQCLFG